MQKLPRKVIQRCLTAEYQHATKDANFSAQESLDERRRYVLSPHCLFRKETFHASDKHDSWNIRNKVRTIVIVVTGITLLSSPDCFVLFTAWLGLFTFPVELDTLICYLLNWCFIDAGALGLCGFGYNLQHFVVPPGILLK